MFTRFLLTVCVRSLERSQRWWTISQSYCAVVSSGSDCPCVLRFW